MKIIMCLRLGLKNNYASGWMHFREDMDGESTGCGIEAADAGRSFVCTEYLVVRWLQASSVKDWLRLIDLDK